MFDKLNAKLAGKSHIIKIVCLVLTLMILFEIYSIVSQVSEEKMILSYVEAIREETMEESPHLNVNTYLWEADIQYLNTSWVEGISDFYTTVDKTEWNSQINAILTDITTKYVSDAEIAQRIIDIIPERYHKIAFNDCFTIITKYVDGTLFEDYR